MLEEETSAIYEKCISIWPSKTLVTFGIFIYVWLLWKAAIYHSRCCMDSMDAFFSCNCAAKPHCDVITRKGRYFEAQLAYLDTLFIRCSEEMLTNLNLHAKNWNKTLPAEGQQSSGAFRLIYCDFFPEAIVMLLWQMASWERQHQTLALPHKNLFKIWEFSYKMFVSSQKLKLQYVQLLKAQLHSTTWNH